MLEKSVQLNLQISGKHMVKMLLFLFFACVRLRLASIVFFAVAMLHALLTFRDLFDRSLFGEEAYTYMTLPISMRDMVIGKAIVANVWLMVSFVVVWIAFFVEAWATGIIDLEFGFGGFLLQSTAGVFEAVEDQIIFPEEIMTDGDQLLSKAMGLTVMPVVFLSSSIFLCSVMQLGTIIRQVLDPQRRNLFVTISVIIGCLTVIVGTGAAREGICSLVGGGMTTIWTCLIQILFSAVPGIGLLAASVILLEKKYSLA